MRSRTDKKPKPGKVTVPIQIRPPKQVSDGKKLKTLDLRALIAFNKVKAWVKENEPENYGAFQPKKRKCIKKK